MMYYIDSSLVNCNRCPLHGRPSAILDTNTPKDLTKADVIFTGINPACFLPGTPLLTSTGALTIDNLAKGRQTLDGQVIQQNLGYMVTDYPVYKIKAVKFPDFACTHRHKLLIASRKKGLAVKLPKYLSDPAFIPASGIETKQFEGYQNYLLIPKTTYTPIPVSIDLAPFKVYKNRMNDFKLPDKINLDSDLAFLLGCYLGDGSANFCNGSIQIHLSQGYKEKFVRKVIQIFKRFNVPIRIERRDKRIGIIINSRTLVNFFLDIFGKDCYTKRVPKFMFFADPTLISAFLFGWYVTDGSHNKSMKTLGNAEGIASVSKLAIWDGIILGLKCNILLGLHVEPPKSKRRVDCWSLNFDKTALERLNWPISRNRFKRPSYGEDSQYFYLKIRSIEKQHYTGIVYDKTTSRHSYQIPFIVHNSVEIRLEKPFCGRTGLYGRQMLKSILLEYKWIFTNIALCSTIYNGSTSVPTLETVQHCSINVRRLIRLVQPRIVVLVGQLPTTVLLSEQYASLPMDNLVGQKHSLGPKDINFLQGFVLYHPRYPMQRKGIHLEKQEWAIERLSKVLRCNHKQGLLKSMSKEQWLTRFETKEYDWAKKYH